MIGRPSIHLSEILSKTTESAILHYYLGVKKIPIVINSPLRKDEKPSFGLYSLDGHKIYYTDLATKDRGGLFDLLSKMWGMPYEEVLLRIFNDLKHISSEASITASSNKIKISSVLNSNVDLEVKVRNWENYDLEYWKSYGVSLEWLQYAEVYPISHKIIIKDNIRYTFIADKYAYVYVERKEGKITLKIYQPYNTLGYKWSNKHDHSVLSLWTKIPEKGDKLCICSSLKDALCLWNNVQIPAIATQGEGYNISETVIKDLKTRFKNVYILFDNDEEGIKDGLKLQNLTGFTNIILPKINNSKDISDLYYSLKNKQEFKKIILQLFE